MTDTATAPAPAGPPPGPDAGGPAIWTRDLTKRYGDVVAVDQLSLDVAPGTVFGLIGPNGAGKTTTFAMLASLLKPTSGDLRVLGIDPRKDPYALRPRLGYVPDVLGLYDSTRVEEYLRFFASAYDLPRKAWKGEIDRVLELADLADRRRSMVNALSRGMKQRLSLGRALLHDPDLLILDEPASGLDPRARVELRQLLERLRSQGKTIVISSHILAELEDLCDEVAILQRGRLLADGPPREILAKLGGSRAIRVRLEGGATRTITVNSEEHQRDLLRRLVEAGLPVVEFVHADAGLEALFLRLTADPDDEVEEEPNDDGAPEHGEDGA
jgi:ABC-2 type transport system ATP-binding protein